MRIGEALRQLFHRVSPESDKNNQTLTSEEVRTMVRERLEAQASQLRERQQARLRGLDLQAPTVRRAHR